MKNKLQNKRTEIIEIILVSIVIAFGINFISTGIVSLFELNNYIILLIIGIIICLLVIFYYILSIIKSLNIKKIILGNIIISKKSNRIIGINEYSASLFMKYYLDALLLEDKNALKKYNKDMKNADFYCEKHSNLENSYFKYMIDSLIEYLIIDEFTDTIFLNDKNTKILDRNNIKKIIPDNIFIKVLSSNFEKRKVFKNSVIDNEGELWSISTEEGYIYNKLEIKIPKNAKMYKENNHTLIIKSKYFKIRIEWGLENGCLASDYEFYNYFLKHDINKWEDLELNYFIDINVKYKIPILFLKKFDEYYLWIDDIVNRIFTFFDYEECLKQNNWKLLKNIKMFLNK